MKRAFVLCLLLLLVGSLAAARTEIFDSITVEGTATFSGTIGFTGTTISFNPSTSFAVYSPAIYLGYDSGAAITFAVSDTTGNVAITHAGSTKAVTWTAAGGFDFVGAMAADAVTLSDVLTFSDGATIDNTSSTQLTITETTIDLVGATVVDGVTASGAVSIDDVTDSSSTVTGSLHTDGGVGIAKKLFVGTDLDVDGTANLDNTDIDGTLVADGTTAGLTYSTSIIDYTPAFTIGYDAGAAMTITTTDTTGAVAITHAGSAPAVTWTADSFGLVGPLDVGGFFDMGTMDVGIAVTTASPFAMEVHTEPLTALTAGATGLTAGIRSRYHVSVAQPNTISVTATESRLRVKHGLADGTHSAVSGVIEASGTDADFTGTTTTQRSGGFFALDFDADVTLADDGWITGVTINSSVNGAVSMAAAKFAGLRISTNATCEAWEQGIVLDDSAAVVGIDIGTCATDIVCQNDEQLANAADGVVTLTGDDVTGIQFQVISADHDTTGDASLVLDADAGGDASDTWTITSQANGNDLSILNATTEVVNVTTSGDVQMDGDLTVDGGDILVNSDYQPITEYIAFDIEEATMDADDGTGIKVASVDVNATGLILRAFVNVTQGYNEASDTIELVINDTDNVATPTTTLVGATDTSAAHLLAYQPATGSTVLGATSTTNRYVVVGYKDVGNDGGAGANLQGVLIVTYLKQ